MNRIGVRELRATAAATVRRAEAGQRTVITVAGRPVAQIGPIATNTAARSLDELVAQGLLIAPRRAGFPSDSTVGAWGNLRLDRLLREVRG